MSLLALALAEPLWGSMWEQVVALPREWNPASNSSMLPSLPYAHARAPSTRVWQWLKGGGEGLLSRDAWLALALAGVLSLAIGPLAVLGSVAVALLALLGAALAPVYPSLTRFLSALVGIALPWWLGYYLFAGSITGISAWPTLDPAQAVIWLLSGVFTLLAFLRQQLLAGASYWWLRLTYVGLVLGLVALHEPLAAGLTAVVLTIPTFRPPPHAEDSLDKWHWLVLALIVIALAWLP